MYYFIFAILPQAYASCMLFRCGIPSTNKLTSSVCSVYDSLSNTTYIEPCTGNYVCSGSFPGSSSECVYQSPYTPGTQVAGARCTFDQDCVRNNKCVSSSCKGLSLNLTCSSNLDCDVGLYCSPKTSVCTSQIPVGGTGCTEDADCVNNAGCQIYSLTNPAWNLCARYFSLADYTALVGCSAAGDVNYLCASGYCVNIGTSICYPAPRLATDSPVGCSSNTDCISRPAGKQQLLFYSECSCGLNSKGTQVCEVMPGDKVYDRYDEMVRDWMDSDGIKKCNTYGRVASSCMETHWGKSKYKEFLRNEYRALMYPQVYAAEECLVKEAYPQYYNALDFAQRCAVVGIMALSFF